jgi:anti-anti-sigma factor
MDAGNSTEFEQTCNVWIQNKITHVILDMSELAYVSSMGLRHFVNVGKTLQENGGTLRLCGVHGLVKQLFQITRLNNVFPIHETVADSLSSI